MRARAALATLLLAGFPATRATAVPWPLNPSGSVKEVVCGFGQFAEDNVGAGFHFHEGVDIRAADGTPVIAIADGFVEEVRVTAPDQYLSYVAVSDLATNTAAYLYLHIRIANNSSTAAMWAVNDFVAVGDTIGVVDTFNGAGIYVHTHLGRHTNTEGGWHPTGAPPPPVLGDPFEDLSPNGDNTKPTTTELHFRRAQDEGTAAATYQTSLVDGKKVVYGNLDVIARIQDRFEKSGAGGFAWAHDLNPSKVSFKIVGDFVGFEVLEHFSGQFITPPNSLGQFYNPTLAQVIYEVDNTLVSNQDLAASATNRMYFILTNKDDDEILELTDDTRYWNSNVDEGPGPILNQWNTPDAAGNDAKVNEKAVFGDGRKKFVVEAIDEAGNTATDTTAVNLDNFKPYVKTVEIGSPVVYKADWTWDGSALQFQKTIDLYVPAGNHPVKIVFSEPVKSPTLNVSTFGAPIVLTSTDPTDEKVTWTGTLAMPAADSSHDGQQTFTILAKDMANNDLDGDPPTLAARDAAGAWTDANVGGNKDELHKPKLDATAPTSVITVTQ